MLYKGFQLLLLILLGLSLTLTEGCQRSYPGVCPSKNAQPLCMRINCKDHAYAHGYYWVLYNYIPDSHGNIRCCTTVTYCTHCDCCRHCYQDNMMPIAKLRRAPIICAALYALGDDFEPPLQRVLRSPEHEFDQQWVSFHIYFLVKHMPGKVPNKQIMTQQRVDVSCAAPKILEVPKFTTARTWYSLLYPINVDPYIARDASLTHNMPVSDTEHCLSPYLDNRFMPMLCCYMHQMQPSRPTVCIVNIIEISKDTQIPNTKAMLQYLLQKFNAVTFYSYTYSWCLRIHTFIPTDHRISEFHATNHTVHKHWKPIYIGTVNDPLYGLRTNCEQMRDKHMLENSFQFQRPGIKKKISSHHKKWHLGTYEKFPKFISTEYVEKLGKRSNCTFDIYIISKHFYTLSHNIPPI